MASLIEIETGRTGYHTVIDHVLKVGVRRAPRGLSTLDAGWTTVVIADPSQMLPLGVGRKLNPSIGAAEAVQLIGGFSDPGLMFRISPHFIRFAEPDTHQFHGAYGRRIRHGDQLASVIRKLQRDPDTRQAVITLWDPLRDNTQNARDIPCTVALHFALVGGRLDMNVVMRSNDLFRGFPYDIFQFGQLMWTCATLLCVKPGTYRHTAWSLHLYESDLEAVASITTPTGDGDFQPTGLARPYETVEDVIRSAHRLTYASPVNPTPSEQWYRRYLK